MSKRPILDDYLELITYGFTNPMPDAEEGPWKVTAKDIIDGEINFDTARKTTQKAYETELTNKSRPKIGDVLLTKDGTLGRLAIVKEKDICVNQSVAVLRPNEKILPEYLFYLLSTPKYQQQLIGDSDGTVIKHIYISRVGKMEVDIPSIEEQQERLTHLLSIDKKIKLNRQTNQTLEQITQAIFKSWFVDFDPVRAKIAAREAFIQQHPEVTLDAIRAASGTEGDTLAHAGAKACELAAICTISGKSEEQLNELDADALEQLKAIAALFPDMLEESELGEVPEGWRVSQIGNEVVVLGGGTPSTKNPEFWEGGQIHWTTPKDMSNLTDKILLDTERRITEKGLAKISSELLPEGTVLMSSRAPVGYLAISKIRVAINQGYIAMKCEGTLSPEYVVQWAESVMDDIKQRASGTTFAEISKKNFRIIPVVVPTKSIIDLYTKQASMMYSKITESLVETRHLIDTRDTLLPKLLSGEYMLVI